MEELDVAFLFIYNDFLAGKVAIDTYGHDDLKKPRSAVLDNYEHDGKIDRLADKYIKEARNGNFLYSIEVLLLAAHYLENKWPLPDSLANYIAKALQDSVIEFGHAEGNADRKNAAVAKTLGLTRPHGAATKSARLFKQTYVYCYIWWRMKICGETKYTAAKHAETAFNGTKRLTQDACEKIYDASVIKYGASDEPSLSLLFTLDHKLNQNQKATSAPEFGIYFSDDDFLKDALPYIDDTHRNKKEWMQVYGLST